MSIDKPTSPSDSQPQISWHALTSDQILQQLATPPETGLTSEEAARRLECYGPNQLTEAPGVTFWQMLIDQFKRFRGDHVDRSGRHLMPYWAIGRKQPPSWQS